MTEATPVEQELIGIIKQLLWGHTIKNDIFSRWSQGFYFSKTQESALEQRHGGPCSILAPVQAFIIKNLLIEAPNLLFDENIPEERQNAMLIGALSEILRQCSSGRFLVAYLQVPPSGSQTVKPDHNNEQVFFHKYLHLRMIDNTDDYIRENIEKFKEHYGILLFLYSVIATKGLEQVMAESDTTDPLIDDTYGYGSQSLINLMITGRAVTYVWDFDQDVGGLKLKGLDHQSQIGFITLMEHLRYCTVGTFYKNPLHPVWVLGSETHLTVLFSDNKRLVSPETRSEEAQRVFKKHDKDGNNFINADKLQEVLQELQLVSDEGYVDIMRKKLDSESLGIVLMNAFMEEFFPREESSRSTPDTFQLVHYNGLPQSNQGSSVRYRIGTAVLLETDLRAMCDGNPMLTCLQTKWPSIEINWQDSTTPSLN